MTMLILNGSNRIQCMLSSYIINIVSVRLLQCTNHIIDVRKTLMLIYTTSSGACTACSGIPPFLLLWCRDNFTTLYCPAQHDRSDAKFIIIYQFIFILSFSYPDLVIIWNLQCRSLRTLQWCYLCNYKFRKNKSISESHNRNCSNRVFYAYGHCRHCMQEHRVPGIHNETMYCGSASNHSRKEDNGSVSAAAFREKR